MSTYISSYASPIVFSVTYMNSVLSFSSQLLSLSLSSFFLIIILNYLSSLQLQTNPKHLQKSEIPRIFNFHLLRRLNTKSSFFPPKFSNPQASVNTTFSKTPFFLKNLVGFPSTPAFSYQTPLRCGKLGKFHFYDDLCPLFYPFFETCFRNFTFSCFLPDFTPLFLVSCPLFHQENPPLFRKTSIYHQNHPSPVPT